MNYLEYLQEGDAISKFYNANKKLNILDLFKKAPNQTDGYNNNNTVYNRKSQLENKINKSWQRDNYKNSTRGVPPGAVNNPTYKW